KQSDRKQDGNRRQKRIPADKFSMLLEKFCHPHTIFKHSYGKGLESSSSMMQNPCFRDVQKPVAFLTYSIVQVSILTHNEPLVKTSDFLNCSFFVHCITVRKRADIVLFSGILRLRRASRTQKRFLGISHHPAKYRVSVKDQVRASKTHNVIRGLLHFTDKGFQPLWINLTVSISKRNKFSHGIFHTKVPRCSNIFSFIEKKFDRISTYDILCFIGGHSINDNNLVRISWVI